MRIKKIQEKLQIPTGLDVSIEQSILKMKGSKGTVERDFSHPSITLTKENNAVVLTAEKVGKREKAMVYTIVAHIKNMFKGVQEGHTYRLKICSGHFPMTLQISGNSVTVKNFYGEKVPRVYLYDKDVKVKQEGDFLIVEGISKEKTGQTAASIEQLLRITNRDRRIFQDGIYIIDKDGKEII